MVRWWPGGVQPAVLLQSKRRTGNAAPLPPGSYRLGEPEPWDNSYWLDLLPNFPTTRSALGIHTCLPGVGCICLPDKADTDALARWVKALNLKQLTVLN